MPHVADRATELLPRLAEHRCSTAEGRPFVDELADTEVGHLFEHVTLELMALAGSPRDLTGETSWDWRDGERGAFTVTLGFDDDLVCLGAAREALAFMRYLLRGGPPPDADAAAQRLHTLRERP